MNITVIKVGYNITQIFIGKPTEQIKKWVKDLNDNPLQRDEVTCEEQYADVSLYQLIEFLKLK